MAGIYHNPELGVISLSSDGTNWITIADKNLGATAVRNTGDTESVDNCGYVYQRGNNRGFNRFVNFSKTSGTTDASAYGPNNYYSGPFRTGNSYWDGSNNANLWGDTTNTLVARRGPCAEGYHVATSTEWGMVAGILSSFGLTTGGNARDYLKMPYAGVVSYTGSVSTGYGIYWSSSIVTNTNSSYSTNIDDSFGFRTTVKQARALGGSIRPFKNEFIIPDYTWTKLYGDDLPVPPTIDRFVLNGNYYYFKNAPKHISGISLNKDSISLNTVGQTEQLTATITPEDAVEGTDVAWSSSDTSIATVSNTGLVTCVTPGDCIITATASGGYTVTCEVTNFQPVDQFFSYTGAEQSILLQPATYCLEVWGASGFCNPSYASGRGGGYSSGCITLESPQTAYVYVGGHPTGQAGGWNGGGNGYSSYGMGGGGGTDIRMGGKTLCNRIIVAGGSGGNNCAYSYNGCYCTAQGGAGGGACGMEGYYNCYNSAGQNRSGGGASQTSGGVAWSTNGSAGSFGKGGTSCSGYNAGGGGGGWYGGGGAYDSDSDNDGRGGGGGSGYTWTADTCSYNPAPACLSGIPYLTGAVCCPGCVSFPSPSGSTETGHFGHGCVRIRSL